MEVETPRRETLAKDFLRLSPAELQAKYPEDEEIQGALAQISLIQNQFHTEDESLDTYAMIESALMKRVALNLAQGLPILVPNIDDYYREITAQR
ncbi:hypothetical protein [uncultured Marinobacter sp.]|uniref:hypothetical protein n=1 Tax=uncultured Marinobacter sp. TaxID=187379 RepID=UPI0026194E29|nr:hypothetical protein [uncultured Marinobacter sp.]